MSFRNLCRVCRIPVALGALWGLTGCGGHLATVPAGATPIGHSGHPLARSPQPAKGVQPDRPGALAVGPHGHLYIADAGRHQILKRLPSGRFVVVAGTGHAGYSRPGGAAVQAAIKDPVAMVFGPHGTLYFADSGTNRVQAISPQGRIATVAGNGRAGPVTTGMAALKAPLGAPSALAWSPHGHLIIAAAGSNAVVRLAQGRLTVLAANYRQPGLNGMGRPATQGSPDGPVGVAVNRAGDLYIAGFNTKTLLEITASGRLTQPPGYPGIYPGGPGGALLATPTGQVVGIGFNRLTIGYLTPQGLQTIINFAQRSLPDGIRYVLPAGLAVGRHGTIYTDTAYGNGYTNASAIVAISPNGTVRVLWHGPITKFARKGTQ